MMALKRVRDDGFQGPAGHRLLKNPRESFEFGEQVAAMLAVLIWALCWHNAAWRGASWHGHCCSWVLDLDLSVCMTAVNPFVVMMSAVKGPESQHTGK